MSKQFRDSSVGIDYRPMTSFLFTLGSLAPGMKAIEGRDSHRESSEEHLMQVRYGKVKKVQLFANDSTYT